MDIDREDLRVIIKEVINELNTSVELGQKWDGGQLILKPAIDAMQSKSMPIETFFHKIVMVRNQLRVLEQKINAHPKLADSEKVEMQQYISRCYGSLTSFNVLFRKEEDRFKGSGGE